MFLRNDILGFEQSEPVAQPCRVLFFQPLGAACHDATRARQQLCPDHWLPYRGGDIAECADQSSAESSNPSIPIHGTTTRTTSGGPYSRAGGGARLSKQFRGTFEWNTVFVRNTQQRRARGHELTHSAQHMDLHTVSLGKRQKPGHAERIECDQTGADAGSADG